MHIYRWDLRFGKLTPERLKEAVASCEKAIDHSLKLPLEVDNYRCDLPRLMIAAA